MSEAMYKFIPIEEWLAEEEVVNEQGETVMVRTCPEAILYPNARVSTNEVVISCNDGDGTHTWEEAKAHIEANWPKVEETI